MVGKTSASSIWPGTTPRNVWYDAWRCVSTSPGWTGAPPASIVRVARTRADTVVVAADVDDPAALDGDGAVGDERAVVVHA